MRSAGFDVSFSGEAMIAQDKMNDALYALNAVLVHARTMAFEHAAHGDLARVLDVAELLPMLIAENADATAQFRGHLEALVQMNAGFGFALERFDGLHGMPNCSMNT
jgi:hypothetical protein